jgi:hypothetical protein
VDECKTLPLALALFMNAHSDFFFPLSINYMGLGDKEIMAMAFLHLGRAVQVDSPNYPIFIMESCQSTQSSPLNLANLPNLHH